MLFIHEKIYGLDVNCDIPVGVNFFRQLSGTGKTFFFMIVASYCHLHSLSYLKLSHSYMGMSEKTLLAMITDTAYDVITVDDADLYLNDNLVEALKKTGAVVMVAYKSPLLFTQDAGEFFLVRYVEDTLDVLKW